MGIVYTTITSVGLGTGSPLKGTIYNDLNCLIVNDNNLQAQINALTTGIKFKDCGGNCAGSCWGNCVGSCIGGCSSCAGGCTSCSGCSSNCGGGCGNACSGR